MGRIFETRKATMFARWDKMAKAFTRVGKDIEIAVRAAGPNPDSNPQLRRVLQNARAVNMPKDKVEAAIKRASGEGAEDWDEVTYEAYAPHGIALMVVTATNNPTRTVANVRAALNKLGGNLASSGAVSFMFEKMGVFRLNPEGLDPDELELQLIDSGLQELGEGTTDNGDPVIVLRCAFSDFGELQSGIEEHGLEVVSSDSEWVPSDLLELDEEQATDVLKLVDRLEQDDDVQQVFHNLK